MNGFIYVTEIDNSFVLLLLIYENEYELVTHFIKYRFIDAPTHVELQNMICGIVINLVDR